jgi:S1-C subfamily serine protease
MSLHSPNRRLLALFALALFGSGVCTGRALSRAKRAAKSAGQQSSGTPIAVELTRASPGGPDDTVKHLTPAAHPQSTAPASSPRLPVRKIAQRALATTVFLRGGNVYGAGVLIDKKGHVLTCDHVIDGLKHVRAWFYGESKPVAVKVVARDHNADLALLSLARLPARAPAVLGSITGIAMGDTVFSMGAPMKMTFSMSQGIVSYVGRSFDGTGFVQTDLPANAGSSGGPVLNDRGELVGVMSFILRGGQGLTFAVPIDYAFKSFASQLGVRRDSRRFDKWLESGKPDSALVGTSPLGRH